MKTAGNGSAGEIAPQADAEADIATPEDLVALSDQAILVDAKWSDTRGYTMTLQITEADAGGHPLKTFGKGTRFHLVLVELADDEEPINQILKKKLENELQDANKGGRLSIDCGIMCKSIDYHRYLFTIGKMHAKWDQRTKETMAREHVLHTLKIKSRREIDHKDHTAAAYQNLILDPFHEWERNRSQRGRNAR